LSIDAINTETDATIRYLSALRIEKAEAGMLSLGPAPARHGRGGSPPPPHSVARRALAPLRPAEREGIGAIIQRIRLICPVLLVEHDIDGCFSSPIRSPS